MDDEAGREGPIAFLREALASLFARPILFPAVVLAVLLTASNITILLNRPGEGPSWPFVLAALARVVGLVAVAVAVLRILNGSERPVWRPDAAFWLYGVTLLGTMTAASGARFAIAGQDDAVGGFLASLGAAALTAPLAPWFVAIAVARPLAWRPGPWLHRFRLWLPWLLAWTLLIVTPLGEIHVVLDRWLLAGAGEWFWQIALVDGPFSAGIALLGLALASLAYRRVAPA